MQVTRQFLEHLYPDNIPSGNHVLVWTIPGKTSYWFTDTEELTNSLELFGNRNIYIGCGLSPKNYGSTKRARANQISGIPGLWADIDYGDTGHKGKTYPPTEAAAIQILDELAVRPSIVIHSGNGLQAWWLWDEPWIFKDKIEREHAAEISKAWGAILNEAAGEYTVDSVSDLSRVLRLPGSNNVKDPDNPKPVRIISEDGPRWGSHEDFISQAGITLDPARSNASPKPSTTKEPSSEIPQGDPPVARMTLLWSVDPKAQDVWMGKDAPWLKDQSDSSRDLSVATRAALAGWPALEIGQLIRSGRELRGADLKHPQYYDLTIRKAMDKSKEPGHVRDADEALGVDPDNATPELRLERISELIGVAPPITRITKTDSDPVIYRLYWQGRRMEIGDSSGILEQNKFRRVMADIAGVVVTRRKAPEWDKIAQMFLNCVTILKVGAEGEAVAQMEAFMDEYFEQFGGDLSADWKTRCRNREPFIIPSKDVSDGDLDRVCFATTGSRGLSAWIWAHHNLRPTTAKLVAILRELGWTPAKRTVRDGDDVFKRSFWFKEVKVDV